MTRGFKTGCARQVHAQVTAERAVFTGDVDGASRARDGEGRPGARLEARVAHRGMIVETAHVGVNRLVRSLRDSRVPAGSNVFAELGTTWFCLLRRPEEAAHVLGKLLVAVGEDNVLWGTDAIWYGPSQVAIDAFRAFQIPSSMREQYGYPELTPQIKQKVLGANAARIYGIDLAAARLRSENDDLAWVRAAMAEYRAKGSPGL